MTGLKFEYKIDKQCRTITLSILGGVVLAGGLLWWLSPGEYLPVWFASIAFAVVLLTALSIPRNIRITPEAVEIRCLVEITHISYNHIRSMRRAEKAEFRPFVPVFASPGFFGYFGYWLDLQNWDFVKVYATSWQGLVLIEDIYEQRYLVSADDPDKLCEEIDLKIKKLVI
jgi:hypothetical protein